MTNDELCKKYKKDIISKSKKLLKLQTEVSEAVISFQNICNHENLIASRLCYGNGVDYVAHTITKTKCEACDFQFEPTVEYHKELDEE